MYNPCTPVFAFHATLHQGLRPRPTVQNHVADPAKSVPEARHRGVQAKPN